MIKILRNLNNKKYSMVINGIKIPSNDIDLGTENDVTDIRLSTITFGRECTESAQIKMEKSDSNQILKVTLVVDGLVSSNLSDKIASEEKTLNYL